MDPAADVSIQNASNWLEWVVDLGSFTTATNEFIVDFPFSLENVKQVYFMGYYANNLSTHKIRVGMEASGFNMLQHNVSFLPVGNCVGTQLIICEPGTGAAAVRRDLNTPIPLFNDNNNMGRVARFKVSVGSWAGTTVSATELILFFGLILQPAEKDPTTQYQMLPRSAKDRSLAAPFHYRT